MQGRFNALGIGANVPKSDWFQLPARGRFSASAGNLYVCWNNLRNPFSECRFRIRRGLLTFRRPWPSIPSEREPDVAMGPDLSDFGRRIALRSLESGILLLIEAR